VTLFDFIFTVAAVMLGVIAGYYVLRTHLIRQRKKRLQMLGMLAQDILDELKSKIVDCKLEKHNDEFFLYNRETNEFLAQGKTYDDICETLKVKYPSKYFNVTGEDLDELKSTAVK